MEGIGNGSVNIAASHPAAIPYSVEISTYNNYVCMNILIAACVYIVFHKLIVIGYGKKAYMHVNLKRY